MSEKKNDFAKQIERLDVIVDKVSSDALPLDESLKLYEKGIQIIKELEEALQAAEQKVEEIISTKGK